MAVQKIMPQLVSDTESLNPSLGRALRIGFRTCRHDGEASGAHDSLIFFWIQAERKGIIMLMRNLDDVKIMSEQNRFGVGTPLFPSILMNYLMATFM